RRARAGSERGHRATRRRQPRLHRPGDPARRRVDGRRRRQAPEACRGAGDRRGGRGSVAGPGGRAAGAGGRGLDTRSRRARPDRSSFARAMTARVAIDRLAAPLLAAVMVLSPVAVAAGPAAELPRTRVDTSPPAGGRVVTVPAGGDLQAALDRASPGDVISLAPGASYAG